MLYPSKLARTRMAGAVLLVALVAGGCEDFLDVNEDPNAPENARIDVRMPAVITGVLHSVYYGDPPLWGVEWTQQTSYNDDTRNYDELHLYEVQDNSPNGWWSYYYSSILNETKLIMEQADPDEEAAYLGLARFISAWTWAMTTDFWGPIPFTEALDPAVATPAYDNQPDVYAAVFSSIDQAVTEMRTPSARAPGAGDLLFDGDMDRWVQLARHVQARHHLRLAYAPWADANQHAQAALAALQEGLTSNADDADFQYTGGSGSRNPLWLFQDRGDLFKASEMVVTMLQDRNDPRLPIMVMPALADLELGNTVYRGHKNGAAPAPDSTLSQVGEYFVAEDAPVNIASYADAKFTEAEARLIVTGAAAADAPYREGIRANMEKWGVAAADIDTYLAARPSLTTLANPLEEIIREKYIANYLKVEPWHDWRRTGYPVLQPVSGAVISGIPVRIRTPSSELANNEANVLATGVPTGLDGMLWESAQVWWGGS